MCIEDKCVIPIRVISFQLLSKLLKVKFFKPTKKGFNFFIDQNSMGTLPMNKNFENPKSVLFWGTLYIMDLLDPVWSSIGPNDDGFQCRVFPFYVPYRARNCTDI